jgi:hypothetical protein
MSFVFKEMNLDKNFGTKLVEELNLDNLPKKKKNKLAKKFEENLHLRLGRAFMSRVDPSKREKLNEILENGGDLRSFLKRNISNPQEIIDATVKDLKSEARNKAKSIRKGIEQAKMEKRIKKEMKKGKDEYDIISGITEEHQEEEFDRMRKKAEESRQKKIRRLVILVVLILLLVLIYFLV